MTVLLALLGTGGAPASGAVIIDYDSRYIYGSVHLYDYGPCPNDPASTCLNDSASEYFQQYPETSGAPFLAAGEAAAVDAAGQVSASMTQDSIAGPLTFGGTGTGNMDWTVSAGDYGSTVGVSFYSVGFRLTSSYAFEYNAAVSGVSLGSGSSGTAISYLYDSSANTYGDTYASAVSYDATPQTDTAQDSGVLGPGSYYLYAYGQGHGYGDATAEATGTFDVLLTLTPLETVPEPASLALLGLGLLGFAAARRHAIER